MPLSKTLFENLDRRVLTIYLSIDLSTTRFENLDHQVLHHPLYFDPFPETILRAAIG